MIISITGTPGTGKTTVSRELAKLLEKETGKTFKVIHLNREILRRKLWSSVDRRRKSKNVDMRRLENFVRSQKRKHGDLILESHLAHYFEADVVFVLRTGIEELRKRMKKRGWNAAKMNENLEAERLNLILGESLDAHGSRVVEMYTTKKSAKAVAATMLRSLK